MSIEILQLTADINFGILVYGLIYPIIEFIGNIKLW